MILVWFMGGTRLEGVWLLGEGVLGVRGDTGGVGNMGVTPLWVSLHPNPIPLTYLLKPGVNL